MTALRGQVCVVPTGDVNVASLVLAFIKNWFGGWITVGLI